MTDRVDRRAGLGVLGVLGGLVAIVLPGLGSDPQRFELSELTEVGPLAPLVRAADFGWDYGIIRTPALLAGTAVVLVALAGWRARAWPRPLLVALAAGVVTLLAVPALLLAVGLREASEPWGYTNDSTYQIELAGDLLLDGENPYGHDYRDTGLPRWYETVRQPTDQGKAALEHFAYFPGTALTAAAWRLLPAPLDDYRFFVLLATLGLLGAALLFPAPLEWRLAFGALLAANPLAVRGVWFGTADAPSLLCLVLALALVARGRYGGAAAALAGAVLLKQFALVAVPFVALMLFAAGASRDQRRRAGLIFGAVLLAGVVPFLVADAGAFWRDTIAYGSGTYRIIGYGLAGLFLRVGLVDDRFGDYPLVPIAAVTWLPATAWLLWNQHRSRSLWLGAAGFAASIFVLFFISRVFQNSYLIWPLTGILCAGLLAVSPRRAAQA